MKKMRISLLLGMLFTLVSSFCWAQGESITFKEVSITRIDPTPATFSGAVTISHLEVMGTSVYSRGSQVFYNGDNKKFYGLGFGRSFQATITDMGIMRTSEIAPMPASAGDEPYAQVLFDGYAIRVYMKKTGTNSYTFYTVKVTCAGCTPMPPGGPIY
jgi:hypothetical protein